ncbi:monovalent cation/H(+) antiporter subunit G [Sphingomonas sp. ac-8]|uniref:monovalent cation/H(+) antiporter subunit G n=1 Tax=Sphingomonas sp. ac-8 TaxID=3242977 RepID=UPI003A7FF81F
MIQAPDLPFWAAALTGFLLLFGATVTLIGAVGLLRLKNFYDRVHAPTLGATVGGFAILLGSIVCFSVLGGRPVTQEVLIGLFVTMTTPVTLMLLVRAAVHRDLAERRLTLPEAEKQED